MQIDPPRFLIDREEEPYQPADIFSRMGDIELLAELRRIAMLAGRREDHDTAERAGELFASFYMHHMQRTQARVPDWLWESTRSFVRQHAP